MERRFVRSVVEPRKGDLLCLENVDGYVGCENEKQKIG